MVETVSSPQNVGAVGAAIVVAVGLGVIDGIGKANLLIDAEKKFNPNKENKPVYDKMFAAYKEIYPANKKIFKMLNG